MQKHKKSWGAAAVLALLMAGAAWFLLRPATVLGPATPPTPQLEAGAATSSVDAMARRLEGRTEATASDWELLARSYAALGRWPEADNAYIKAIAQAPRNASLLAERAVVLIASREVNAPDRAANLVIAALAMDPLQPTALALALGPALKSAPAR